MSQPEDIDKLLREIEAMNRASGSAQQVPAQRTPGGLPAEGGTAAAQSPQKRRSHTRGGRLAWTGVGAVGGLVTGGLVGTVLAVLPYVSTLSTAVGAAIGGAVVGFASGPPGWFDRQ